MLFLDILLANPSRDNMDENMLLQVQVKRLISVYLSYLITKKMKGKNVIGNVLKHLDKRNR